MKLNEWEKDCLYSLLIVATIEALTVCTLFYIWEHVCGF